MRRATVLLTAVGLVWAMTACGSGEKPASSAQPSPVPPSVAPTPSVTPSAAAPPATPKGPTATGGGSNPRPAPSRSLTAPPSGGGEVPGGLPWGDRTLTGRVERAGGCTMLLVGERRWALTGDVAATLSPGAQVTVHGNLAPLPAACGDRDLAQTVAVQRVEPA